MLLVVCDLDDEGALWFARRAAQRADCKIVITEALSYAPYFSHRLAHGGVQTVVRLADGTRLADGEISGVLNRAVQPPASAWRLAAPARTGLRHHGTARVHAQLAARAAVPGAQPART